MNIGIIGAGNIAKKMAKTINKMTGFSNYAIASRSMKKANRFKSKYKFEKAYDSYEKMVQDPNVELVYIATPHSCHYEQMLLCLKYKKPVLCEKIITTSMHDTIDIYEKFEKENVFLCEALWTSFMPSRNIINELIFEKNLIGNPINMKASFKVPLMNKERVKKRELGGGVLMDIGIYPVTFILRTFGFDYDKMTIKNLKNIKGVDAKETLVFDYPNGVQGIAKVDGTFLTSLLVKIKGDKGYILTDMVNCPNFIIVANKFGFFKFINCKPKFGGFEYELEACKYAIENGKIECPEWSHKDSIAMAKIEDEVVAL